MKKKIQYILYIGLSALVVSGISCKKYLDEKSNKSFVVPNKLKDLQALMDYYPTMNAAEAGAAEVSVDDYYLTDALFESLSPDENKRMYLWNNDYLFSPDINDWLFTYKAVYSANTVLEVIQTIGRDNKNQTEWDNVKGQALFFRARMFQQIAYIWAPAYDESTAANDLGIPLRLNTDFNKTSERANVAQTYTQIINDLKQTAALLPVTPVHVMRPSKPAAFALLARTYLSMRRYEDAGKYADSCLQLKNSLLDFNTLSATANFPIAQFNTEVLAESNISMYLALLNSYARIDPELYKLYQANDLRKTIFFKSNGDGSFAYKGSYEGSTTFFSGVATDEVYLMRAECYARQGNITAAMKDLNDLLRKRWKTGTYVNYTATNTSDALAIILPERRKELVMRSLRWMDIKRLNKEGAGINLTRTIKGTSYTLPANDKRFALPIPESVISLSGMQQNPR